jgi:hypothetical protein
MDQQKEVQHTRASLYEIFYSTKQKKTYTTLVASLLLFIIFLAGALVPTFRTLDDRQDQIAEYQEINQKLENKIIAVRNLNDQRSTPQINGGLQDQINYLNRIFPENTEVTNLYFNLYERAKNADARIVNISVNYEPLERPNLNQDLITEAYYSIDLQVFAVNAKKISDYITSLEGAENMPIPIEITNLSIVDALEDIKSRPRDQQAAISAAANGITANITIRFYLDTTRFTQN